MSTAPPCKQQAAAHPELQGEGPQKLVVLGSEVGGRFNGDAQRLVRDLGRLRFYRAPPVHGHLWAAAASGWTHGPHLPTCVPAAPQRGCSDGLDFSPFLSFAAARSFAASLLSLSFHGTANVDGPPRDLSDVLAELDSPPHPSRLPVR